MKKHLFVLGMVSAFALCGCHGTKKVDFAKFQEEVKALEEVKVTEVKLSGKAEMEINEEQTLTLQVLPADATNKAVDFATSDATVLTVDANGKVKALKAGTAKVTATAKDEIHNGKLIQ